MENLNINIDDTEYGFVIIGHCHDSLMRVGFYLAYQKRTKVMYSVTNEGVMTPLVNADGTPLLYDGDVE